VKERSGLIVWLHSTKNIRALRRYGSIYYFSRRLKYVSMYCDLDEREEIVNRLEKLRYVKRVDLSFLHEIKREYTKKDATRQQVVDDESAVSL
jgi:uncharacterized protein YlbG (UPF0298 family)